MADRIGEMLLREKLITDEQLESVLSASKPVPYLIIGGMVPRSPQENANAAWQAIATAMGFVWDTVRPLSGKGDRHFTAEEETQCET